MTTSASVLLARHQPDAIPSATSRLPAANDNSAGREAAAWLTGNAPAEQDDSDDVLERGALASFLAAGAVLFASLVIGSSGSLLVTGSDAMLAAIGQAFLSLGLKAAGAGFTAVAISLAVAASWRHFRHA